MQSETSDTNNPECLAAAAVSAELALGVLDGAEREAALLHIHACDACAHEAATFRRVADSLLEAVPEATPLVPLLVPAPSRADAPVTTAPAGGARSTRRGWRRPAWPRPALLTPVFATGVAAVAAIAILLSGPARLQSPTRASASLTLAGQSFGDVSLTTGKHVSVAISLRDLPDVRSVRCIVWQHSGRGATIGSFTVSNGRASWSGQSPWPVSTLRSVELVSASGRKVAAAHIHF